MAPTKKSKKRSPKATSRKLTSRGRPTASSKKPRGVKKRKQLSNSPAKQDAEIAAALLAAALPANEGVNIENCDTHMEHGDDRNDATSDSEFELDEDTEDEEEELDIDDGAEDISKKGTRKPKKTAKKSAKAKQPPKTKQPAKAKKPATEKKPRASRKSSGGVPNPNGRFPGRQLIPWHRVRMAEKLLLIIIYQAQRDKYSIPWDKVIHRLEPGSGGASAVQHLNKLKNDLIAEGHMIPPPLGKMGEKCDPAIRGFVRDMSKESPYSMRPLTWHEKYEHSSESLFYGKIKGSGNYRRAKASKAQCQKSPEAAGDESVSANSETHSNRSMSPVADHSPDYDMDAENLHDGKDNQTVDPEDDGFEDFYAHVSGAGYEEDPEEDDEPKEEDEINTPNASIMNSIEIEGQMGRPVNFNEQVNTPTTSFQHLNVHSASSVHPGHSQFVSYRPTGMFPPMNNNMGPLPGQNHSIEHANGMNGFGIGYANQNQIALSHGLPNYASAYGTVANATYPMNHYQYGIHPSVAGFNQQFHTEDFKDDSPYDFDNEGVLPGSSDEHLYYQPRR